MANSAVNLFTVLSVHILFYPYTHCFKAHYSFSKAASFLGLGVDSVVYIETNERGIMKTDKLTEMINLDIEKVFVFIDSIYLDTWLVSCPTSFIHLSDSERNSC